jgi:hypothetical protein
MYPFDMSRGQFDISPVLEPEVQSWDSVLLELEHLVIRGGCMTDLVERRFSMAAAVGIWAERIDLQDTKAYLRALRDDDRLERLAFR